MGNTVTIDGFTLDLPWLHFGVMGKPGTGKSRLLASMPKKLLAIIVGDPRTKLQPYLDVGIADTKEHVGPLGQTIILVRNAEGEVIIQIECFWDVDPTMSESAMTKVVGRMAAVVQEVNAGMWKSVAFDSWSGFEDAASYRRLIGPMSIKNPDGRAHRAIAKEDCRSVFIHQLVHLNCNVGIAFHVTKFTQENGGETTYNMKCIGDFASTVGQYLAERYHSESLSDGVTRRLRTRPDGRFELATLIEAPDPCDNSFGALFGPMITKKLAAAKAAAENQPKA